MMKKSFLAIGVAISLTIAGTAIYSVTQTTQTSNKAILNNSNSNTNSNKDVTPTIQPNSKSPTKVTSDTESNKNDTKQSESHPILNTQKNTNSNVNKPIVATTTVPDTNAHKIVSSNDENNQNNINVNSNNNSTNSSSNKNIEANSQSLNNNNNNSNSDNDNNKNTSTQPNNSTNQNTNNSNTSQKGYTENLSPAQTYSNIVASLKKFSKPNTAFVTNLNNYHLVNGVKYYNVYEYVVGNKKESWNFDGNYSNFLGAFYVSANGKVLNTQFNQDYSNLSTSEKKAQILEVANQFISYLPNQSGSLSVDMSKTHNFEGYECYLVNYGENSFYMNPSGYIYVSKDQVFY